MKVGDRISVNQSIKVYNHPTSKGTAFDIKDSQGEIVAIITEWQGRPISPNYPYQVQLGDKFKVHLGEHEIELIT
jgi:hypothetical protein